MSAYENKMIGIGEANIDRLGKILNAINGIYTHFANDGLTQDIKKASEFLLSKDSATSSSVSKIAFGGWAGLSSEILLRVAAAWAKEKTKEE